MAHLTYTKHGRIFADGKTKRYVTKVGQKNVEVAPGEFAPFLWDDGKKSLRFGDSELLFTAEGLHFVAPDQTTFDCAFHPEVKKGQTFDRPTVIVSGLKVKQISNEDAADRFEVSYDLDTDDQKATVTIEVGGNNKAVFGFNIVAKKTAVQRLTMEVQKTKELKEIRAFRDNVLLGFDFDACQWKWDRTELADHVLEDKTSTINLNLKEKAYTKGESITVKPDTWSGSVVDSLDDGYQVIPLSYWQPGEDDDWCGCYDSNKYEHLAASFVVGAIADGSTITKAYYRGYCTNGSAVTYHLSLRVENGNPASIARYTAAKQPSEVSWVTNRTASNWVHNSTSTWYHGENDTYPVNLASDIQYLLDTYGIDANGRINVCLFNDADVGATSDFSFQDYIASGTNEAEFAIEWTESTPINLTVQEDSHGHSADNVALTQVHNLAPADGTNAHSTDAVALTQVHNLVVQDGTNAHAADNTVVSVVSYLEVADGTNAHSADNIELTTIHILAPNDASHTQTTDTIALIQAHNLTVADGVDAHTTDSIALTQLHVLDIADDLIDHTADNVDVAQLHILTGVGDGLLDHTADGDLTLVQAHNLIIADDLIDHTADNVDVVEGAELEVAEATHDHTADVVTLTQVHNLTVQDGTNAHTADGDLELETNQLSLTIQEATHAHAADGDLPLTQVHQLHPNEANHLHHGEGLVNLTQLHRLSVQDGLNAHTSDAVVLTQLHILVVAQTDHAHSADNLVLTEELELTVQDGVHDHTVDSTVLTQIHVLSAADGLISQTVDPVALTQAHNLLVNDGLHSFLADNVVLTQLHILTPVDAQHQHTADNIALNVVLVVAGGLHDHSAGGVILTQVHNLSPADGVFGHSTDIIALTQSHNLAIQDGLHLHTAGVVRFDLLFRVVDPSIVKLTRSLYHRHIVAIDDGLTVESLTGGKRIIVLEE